MSLESDPDKGKALDDNKHDETEVKPVPEKKVKDPEIVRMQAALKKIQDEKAELEKYKAEAERAKLSEAERAQADAADLKKKVDSLTRDNAAKEVEITLRDQIDLLIDNGLDGREFGKTVLGFWKEDEETLEAFVERAKEDKKLKKFFSSPDAEPAERPKVPAGPGTGSNRGNKVAEATAEDKAWAVRQYPNDPSLQKRVLEQLKKARVTRAAEESE